MELQIGSKVRNGEFDGTVTRICDGQLTGMIEVRLPGGLVCIGASTVDGYAVGAILDSSWGYDQTNIDFYRIERRKNDTVWLQPLASRSKESGPWGTGTAMPGAPKQVNDFEPACPSCKYDGKLIRRTLKRYTEKSRIPQLTGQIAGCSIKHGWASLWDGKPANWTDYA